MFTLRPSGKFTLDKCCSYANPVQCDKKGRGGLDDPCSECRWFGGKSCKCILAKNSSYNDQLWATMMKRADLGYTLPPYKGSDVAKENKAPREPMPDDSVKADWQGETKEQVLAKGDMLPSSVRDTPRAYLVPPRLSATANRAETFVPSKSATHPHASSPTPSAAPILGASFPQPPAPSPYPPAASAFGANLPQLLPPPIFSRPQPDPQHGEVITTTWSWTEGTWAHTYRSGAIVILPGHSANTPGGQTQLPGVCSYFLLMKDVSLIEQPLQSRYADNSGARPSPGFVSLPPRPSGDLPSKSTAHDDQRPQKRKRTE